MADHIKLDDEEPATPEFPHDDEEDEPDNEEPCTHDFPEDDYQAASTAPSLVLALDAHHRLHWSLDTPCRCQKQAPTSS